MIAAIIGGVCANRGDRVRLDIRGWDLEHGEVRGDFARAIFNIAARGLARAAPAPEARRTGGGDGDVEFALACGNRHGLVSVARQIATRAIAADDRVPGEAEGRIEGRKLSATDSNSTREKPDRTGVQGSA